MTTPDRRPGRPANLTLRARICSLLADGPIRARDAYRVLRSEGWTNAQIDHQRRYVARIQGATYGAEWVALKWPRTYHRESHSFRDARGKFTAEAPVEAIGSSPPLIFKPPEPMAGKCRHGFTVTTKRGDTWACALCEEAIAAYLDELKSESGREVAG